jgi:hypothetical protein
MITRIIVLGDYFNENLYYKIKFNDKLHKIKRFIVYHNLQS